MSNEEISLRENIFITSTKILSFVLVLFIPIYILLGNTKHNELRIGLYIVITILSSTILIVIPVSLIVYYEYRRIRQSIQPIIDLFS